MPPSEDALTEAVREFFGVQGEAVRRALRAADVSYAIRELVSAPPVDAALEETAALLAVILLEHLPAWYAAGWDEAAEQLLSELDMLMRDETDARRRAREIVPAIQTTTRNALQDEAESAADQAEDEALSRDEAMSQLLIGVEMRYEGWVGHRAELIGATESQGALGRGGATLANLVALSQVVEKRNLDRGDDRVCMRCMSNSAAGWIQNGEQYPSGSMHRPHHPRCRCREEYRIAV